MDCPALHSRRCSKGLGSSSDGGLLFCFPVCCGHFYFMAAHKSSPPSFPLHPRAAAAGVGLPPPFTSGAISEANATFASEGGPFPNVPSTRTQKTAAPGEAVQHLLCDNLGKPRALLLRQTAAGRRRWRLCHSPRSSEWHRSGTERISPSPCVGSSKAGEELEEVTFFGCSCGGSLGAACLLPRAPCSPGEEQGCCISYRD